MWWMISIRVSVDRGIIVVGDVFVVFVCKVFLELILF